MRYPAAEKLEIICTVEGSYLPTRQTLDMLGIPRTTFYRWYDVYLEHGFDGLDDRSPRPKAVRDLPEIIAGVEKHQRVGAPRQTMRRRAILRKRDQIGAINVIFTYAQQASRHRIVNLHIGLQAPRQV